MDPFHDDKSSTADWIVIVSVKFVLLKVFSCSFLFFILDQLYIAVSTGAAPAISTVTGATTSGGRRFWPDRSGAETATLLSVSETMIGRVGLGPTMFTTWVPDLQSGAFTN